MLNYNVNQLNSPFDDSAFFIRNTYMKRAFLFDCGRLGPLSHSDVLCLSDIFISHTHMDHFFGFDRILRGSIISEHELRVYGPPGFIDNVDGKFRGYTWNLAEEYKFSVKAFELHPDGNHKTALFKAQNRFVPEINTYSGNKIELNDGFTMEFEFFDHRTLCMGFRITEPVQFSIISDKLDHYGYVRGNWLSKLKKSLLAGNSEELIDVQTTCGIITKKASELKLELVIQKTPQVITYITDCAPTPENIEKAVQFALNSTLLIIEAVFLDEDIEHAVQKNHLTLGLAKNIFFRSNSNMVRFTHFASRYENDKINFMNKLYEGMNGKVHTKSFGKGE